MTGQTRKNSHQLSSKFEATPTKLDDNWLSSYNFTRIVRKRSVFFCAYACHWLCMSIHERIKYTFRYDTVQVENARLSLQPRVISIQQTISPVQTFPTY